MMSLACPGFPFFFLLSFEPYTGQISRSTERGAWKGEVTSGIGKVSRNNWVFGRYVYVYGWMDWMDNMVDSRYMVRKGEKDEMSQASKHHYK